MLVVGVVAGVRAVGSAAAAEVGAHAAVAAVPGGVGSHATLTAAAAARADAHTARTTVRVVSGDTLWGIALRHAPAGTDPRPWIFRTAELNGLHSAVITPGEILRLPAGSRG